MTQTVTLGDIATIHDKNRIPLNSRQRSERKGTVPYYGATGIVDYIDEPLFDGEYVLIGEDGENLRSKKADLAFKVNGKFWVNNHAHIIKGNEPWINDYIVNVFRVLDISPYVTGAAQPKLNQAALIRIPIPWSGDVDSKKIAEILSTIDEKIILNRKMNDTLEIIGQALFRHCFVTNPDNENWENGTVSDLIDIYSGFAFKSKDFDPMGKYGLVTIKNVQDGSFIAQCTDHLADPLTSRVPSYIHLGSGDIILSLTGNVGRICLVIGDDYLLNQRVAKLEGKNKQQAYAYFLFRSTKLKNNLLGISRGTAQMNLSPVETKKLKIKLPPGDVTVDFNEKAKTILEKIISNNLEIQTLTAIRETLLPRLISGKIKV